MRTQWTYQGEMGSSASRALSTPRRIFLSANKDGATSRNVDIGRISREVIAKSGMSPGAILWYIAVCRIDQGDWPSVRSRPLGSTRRRIYENSTSASAMVQTEWMAIVTRTDRRHYWILFFLQQNGGIENLRSQIRSRCVSSQRKACVARNAEICCIALQILRRHCDRSWAFPRYSRVG